MLTVNKLEEVIEELRNLKIMLDDISGFMPDRHFIIDESGIILSHFGNEQPDLFFNIGNMKQRSIFEFSTIEAIGNDLRNAVNKCFSENKMVTLEYSLQLEDFQLLAPGVIGPENRQWFEVKIRPMHSLLNQKRTVVTSTRNITERKLMEQKLHEMAMTDPLTTLYNRRHIMHELERSFERFKRYGTNISVLMLDIDHFKQFNDTYGHGVGDLVLVELAKYLKKAIRKLDVAGRLGGEEFLIIMPDSSVQQVKDVALRLIKGLSELKVSTSEGELSFTVSGGLSEIMKEDLCVDNLLKRADQALYFSKENGRNQVNISK